MLRAKFIAAAILFIAALGTPHAQTTSGLVQPSAGPDGGPVAVPPADPTACKPPAARYVHAGQVGGNWWSYAWCADGSLRWAVLAPTAFSQAGVEAATAGVFGLSVPAVPTALPGDDVIAQLREVVLARIEADKDRPPPIVEPVALVAPNGKYPTRPAYPVIDGAVGTKEGGRANVGEACDCQARKITNGSTTYCAAPPPNAALVAVCRVP